MPRAAASATKSPAGAARSRRAILIVAISAIALETALLGMVAPLLPAIEARTGAGDAALGLAMAAYAIPIVLLSIPAGRAADRIGRRPLLLGGLLLTGLGSLLIAGSESLLPFLAGRAVQGVGSTGSWVAALALVSDLARPGRKGEAIGFALSANSFGAIGGPALGGLVGGSISFEAPFVAVAVVAVGLFAGGVFVLPRAGSRASDARDEPAIEPAGEPVVDRGRATELVPVPEALATGGRAAVPHAAAPAAGAGQPAPSAPGFLAGLRGRGVLAPVCASLIGAAFFGLVDFTVPLDLDRRLGTAATAIGLLFAGVALLDALTSPIAGAAGDRVGRAPIVMGGAVVLVASGVLLIALPGLAGASVAMAAFGIGQAVLFAGTVPWLDEVFGAVRRGLAYGGLNLVYAIGYTVGPLVGGWVLEAASADVVYALISAGALGLIVAIRRAPAPEPPPEPAS